MDEARAHHAHVAKRDGHRAWEGQQVLPAKRQVARECAGRASIARGANTAREICGDVEADGRRQVERGRQARDVKVKGQRRLARVRVRVRGRGRGRGRVTQLLCGDLG